MENEHLDQKIRIADLPSGSKGLPKVLQIETYRELIKYTGEELRDKCKNFGVVRLKNLETYLNTLGLSLTK
jgi:hypothetical protein